MFKTEGEYVFDSFGAEHFHVYFNELVNRYGSVTVADLFENPLLLGIDDPYIVRNAKDHEKFTGILYFRVGWDRPIQTTKMFKIRESKRGGVFEYVLTLPDYKELE